jgi:hypothetical protein
MLPSVEIQTFEILPSKIRFHLLAIFIIQLSFDVLGTISQQGSFWKSFIYINFVTSPLKKTLYKTEANEDEAS